MGVKLNGKHRDLISSDDVNIRVVLLGGNVQTVKKNTDASQSLVRCMIWR